jgi:hypothetical protein
MAEWTYDVGSSSALQAATVAVGPPNDEITDRTNIITAKLKTIYRKTVLPVEKRYKYDYFYESPYLSDVEFDGEFQRGMFDEDIRWPDTDVVPFIVAKDAL